MVRSGDILLLVSVEVPHGKGRQDRDVMLSPILLDELSRAAYQKMIQNLVWATAYNLVALPVAGGLLVHRGIDLPMSVGAVAMSLSTIIVAMHNCFGG